jgi:hypothetical protein
MNSYQKWFVFAPLGLATIGLGASLLGHSIGLKVQGASTLTWFVWGTASLIMHELGKTPRS